MIVDIKNCESPTITATLPLMNSVIGPPTNLAITPDESLALVANSLNYQPEGSGFKPTPDNTVYGKDHPVDAGEGQTAGDFRRSTFSWCRSTRISASSSVRDRKSRAKAHQISLQRSIIAREHQPIRAGLPAGLSFR